MSSPRSDQSTKIEPLSLETVNYLSFNDIHFFPDANAQMRYIYDQILDVGPFREDGESLENWKVRLSGIVARIPDPEDSNTGGPSSKCINLVARSRFAVQLGKSQEVWSLTAYAICYV